VKSQQVYIFSSVIHSNTVFYDIKYVSGEQTPIGGEFPHALFVS